MNKLFFIMTLFMSSLNAAELDDIAFKALTESKNLSSRYEYGGVVYEINGVYEYTTPITSKRKNEVDLSGVTIPINATAVAIYHTHIERGSDFFSVADLKMSKNSGLKSYILDVKSNRCKKIDPVNIKMIAEDLRTKVLQYGINCEINQQ